MKVEKVEIPPSVSTVDLVENGGGKGGAPYRGGPLSSPIPPSTKPNRHPVDELADVRAELKRLKEREDELRALIANGDCDLTGDQHEATVRVQESERIDTERLKRELGMERLRPFVKKATTTVIRVREREVPEDVG